MDDMAAQQLIQRVNKLEQDAKTIGRSGLTSPSMFARLLTMVGYQLLISLVFFPVLFLILWVLGIAIMPR